jgi:glycerol-3-phosphate dehydrogenase
MGYGQSSVAAIVTRGSREMRVLCNALGGKPETLAGLSGVGDLMLTCFSSLSRNNRCGKQIALGKTVDEICD